MAKIKKPAPEIPAPDPEVSAPDIAPLRNSLLAKVKSAFAAEEDYKQTMGEIILDIVEFREENPTIENATLRLTVQEVVAEIKGIKLEHVQTRPEKGARLAADVLAARNSAYVLVSQVMSVVAPKGEEQQKKVAKALKDGEKRFTALVKLASKPQTKRAASDPDKNKITDENFIEKALAFLTKYATDTGSSVRDGVAKMRDEALDAIEAQLDAEIKAEK